MDNGIFYRRGKDSACALIPIPPFISFVRKGVSVSVEKPMGFELVKLIGGLLMPIPVILMLLIGGLGLLLFSRFHRLAAGLLMAGTGLLLVFSTAFLPERTLSGLENVYPVLSDPPAAEWIVVLGGGAKGGADRPPASRLGESSLYRIAEGVRLARMLPGAKLVTSGGSFKGGAASAQLMAEVAAAWGIERTRILVHSEPVNTEGEAHVMTRRIEKKDRVILVTSAFHMPRAVVLFEKAGIPVIPAPAGHMVDPDRAERHIGHQLPQAGNLKYAERAFWEWLGMGWALMRD